MERPTFVVTRRLPGEAMSLLEAAGSVVLAGAGEGLDPEGLQRAVAGARGLVTVLSDRIDSVLLDAAGPSLRVVANVAVGYDNVDVEAARARDVVVTNTPGVLTDATADLAMALILATTRRLGEGERLLRGGSGWKWELDFMLGRGLQGRLLGIVGLGAIGSALARRARAFGMRIAYAGPREPSPTRLEGLDAERLDLAELLRSADVVSLHVPLRESTRHLIGAGELAGMKSQAFLINTSRGPVVDEAALVEALRAGRIAGAGLDVFEREPQVHPALLEMDNVFLAPHLGSATIETRVAMAELAARNVIAVVRGEPALTPVG